MKFHDHRWITLLQSQLIHKKDINALKINNTTLITKNGISHFWQIYELK